jgi:hypothetical protein
MRQGFMIAAVILWVAINILGAISEGLTPLQQTDTKTGLTQQGTLDSLTEPDLRESGRISFATKLGSYLTTAGKIFTLMHPALWQGDAMLIYLFLILPIGISFWVVVVLAIRGVGSA